MSSFLIFGVVGFCIIMAAICSGLNIALASLDTHELKRKRKLGDKRAKRIYPFRKNIHLSLAAILFGNAAFISTETLVLGHKYNGVVAALISTLLLVIFGELLPQAFFNNHAMKIVSKLTPVLKTLIFITYPVAKPLQLILDRWFSNGNKTTLHTRRELGLIMKDHIDSEDSELDDDEVVIIRGALLLSKKQVSDIMTPIERVFWIHQTGNIDSDVIDKIKDSGFSRIPILNKALTDCFGVLLVKDLIDIDFDDETIHLDKFKLHKTKNIGSKTALDTMFRHFIAARTHLMPVTQNDKIVGIVTIEDLIEEIIGHEIVDESDVAISIA